MRDVSSLALIGCLVATTVRLTAQEIDTTARRITQEAGTHEAIRLAATPQTESSVDSNWSRVRKLGPETEVIVSSRGFRGGQRYVVAADDSGITVLNLADPSLPRAARDVLREVASSHPNYFPAAQQGGTFLLDKDVRLAPGGVFVAGRHVADLPQVVEQYRRHEIAEIKTARIESNPLGCALAGYYGGGIVGGIPGALIGGAVGRDSGPALRGGMVGWSIAGVLLYRKCRHTPEKVIY